MGGDGLTEGSGRPAPVPVACRSFASIDGAIAALASLSRGGIPAAVTDVDALGPAEARRVLGLFLHDPGAAAPIEPFAAILAAAVERRQVGLWDILPAGDPSARPARDPGEFLRALPREHPECLACRHFPVCEGYGAWAGSCGTWTEVLAALAAAARELAGLRRLQEEAGGAAGGEGEEEAPEPGTPPAD